MTARSEHEQLSPDRGIEQRGGGGSLDHADSRGDAVGVRRQLRTKLRAALLGALAAGCEVPFDVHRARSHQRSGVGRDRRLPGVHDVQVGTPPARLVGRPRERPLRACRAVASCHDRSHARIVGERPADGIGRSAERLLLRSRH